MAETSFFHFVTFKKGNKKIETWECPINKCFLFSFFYEKKKKKQNKKI